MEQNNEINFNQCIYCLKEPKISKLEDGRIAIKCDCGRLDIISNNIKLSESLWNSANPSSISHATAYADECKIQIWSHGGIPKDEAEIPEEVEKTVKESVENVVEGLFQDNGCDWITLERKESNKQSIKEMISKVSKTLDKICSQEELMLEKILHCIERKDGID